MGTDHHPAFHRFVSRCDHLPEDWRLLPFCRHNHSHPHRCGARYPQSGVSEDHLAAARLFLRGTQGRHHRPYEWRCTGDRELHHVFIGDALQESDPHHQLLRCIIVYLMAANTLHPGDDYNKLPKTILIFILGYDHFKDGLPYHHFTIHDETSNKILNETTEWYILNQKYVDTTTDFGKLMHDLGCPKPNEMFLPPIKDRVEYYKEGAMSMSVKDDIREMFKEEIEQAREEGKEEGIEEGKKEGIEEGKKEGREEGALNNRKEIVLKLLKKGYSLEEIADLLDIPLDEVKAIKE